MNSGTDSPTAILTVDPQPASASVKIAGELIYSYATATEWFLLFHRRGPKAAHFSFGLSSIASLVWISLTLLWILTPCPDLTHPASCHIELRVTSSTCTRTKPPEVFDPSRCARSPYEAYIVSHEAMNLNSNCSGIIGQLGVRLKNNGSWSAICSRNPMAEHRSDRTSREHTEDLVRQEQ